MTRVAHAAARCAAALVLFVVLVGVPVLLVTVVGAPYPSADQLRTAWSTGRVDDDTIVRIGSTLFLLLWGWFTLAALAEAGRVVSARRTAGGRRVVLPPPPPSPAGLIQRLVRLALISTTALASTTMSGSAPAARADVLPVQHAVAAVVAPSDHDSPTARAGFVSTGRDTPYSLASRFGDASMRSTIIDLNKGRPTPSGAPWIGGVFPSGMEVALPPGATFGQTVTWSPYTVQPGDSVFAIAADLAADDDRRVVDVADQIIRRNVGRTMSDGRTFTDASLIFPGWQLEVPVVATVEAASRPAGTPSGTTVIADAVEHVVAPGESYWRIAEDHLRAAGGDPTPTEVATLTATLRAANAPRLGHQDPNMLHPGETVLIAPAATAVDVAPDAAAGTEPGLVESQSEQPAADDGADATPTGEVPTVDAPAGAPVSDSPAAEAAVPEAPPGEPHVAVLPGAEAPGVGGPVDAMESTDAAAPAVATTAVDRAPAPVPAPAVAAPTVPAASGHAAPTRSDEADDDGASIAPVGLGAAVLLAAGALGVLQARRRHQLRGATVGARLRPPTPQEVETETLLRSLDAPERAVRLDLALRSAGHQLASTERFIVGVLLAADATVTLLIDGDAPVPTHPWRPGASAGRWVLPAEVTALELAPAARKALQPCPALIHLGAAADGGVSLGDLFVDLEAIGVLCVEAPEPVAAGILTAIAASLAASPLGETLRVVTTGLDDATHLGNLNAESADSLGSALEIAATTLGSMTSTLLGARTFAARASGVGGEMWEPVVVISRGAPETDDASSRLLDALGNGGRGLGLVVDVLMDAPHWTLRSSAADDVTCRLEPLGLDVTPAGITTTELHALHRLLDSADRPATVELHSVEQASDDPPAAAAFVEQPWSLMVKVLGHLEVVDRAGTAVAFDRGKSLELVAWLSQHRERPTRQAARTALWDLDVRDATFANVVSDARRAMARAVPPPTGEEWIERTLTEQLPLHEQVVSDADLLRARVEFARRLHPADVVEVLRPGLELVQDMPFAGTGYLWPDAEGLSSSLTLLATGAATELARASLALGDVEGVFWATGQGLKVLYGHEELIALRMRAHAHCGDLAGVRNEWEVYERALTSDPWSSGEPSPKLVAIRRELLATG